MRGYRLQAADGEIGHLEDFLVDDEHWQIRYLVIDTRNWWPGRQVLLPPQSVHAIRWSDRRIISNLTRATVRSSPEYDPHLPLAREYESRLYDYYSWPKYWV